MSLQIFLSYCTTDKSILSRISSELKFQGLAPYVATEDIRPGKHISKKIETAIDESDAFLVLLTGNSVKSPWVLQEIGYAKGRIPIIPVKAEDVEAPAMLEGCECIILNDSSLREMGAVIKTTIASWPNETRTEVCGCGPYVIDPGTYEDIELDVKDGDHITGRIDESNGEEFDWYILDERNLVKFKRDEEFTPIRCEENTEASQLNWRVKGNKRWFLLLRVYGKRNPREVSVHLRK